jgi:excisionase family DNA binding protein
VSHGSEGKTGAHPGRPISAVLVRCVWENGPGPQGTGAACGTLSCPVDFQVRHQRQRDSARNVAVWTLVWTWVGTLIAHTCPMLTTETPARGPGNSAEPAVCRTESAGTSVVHRQTLAMETSHPISSKSLASERLVYSVGEAGQLLGISRAFAYELVARGEIPVIRLGRRIVVPKVALLSMVGLDSAS